MPIGTNHAFKPQISCVFGISDASIAVLNTIYIYLLSGRFLILHMIVRSQKQRSRVVKYAIYEIVRVLYGFTFRMYTYACSTFKVQA